MGNQNTNTKPISLDEFYRIINDYIYYSKQSEKKFVKTEDGPDETEAEKSKREADNEKLRHMKKTTEDSMNAVFKLVEAGGISALRYYADVMIRIRDQKEMAKATKDVLVSPKSLSCFRKNMNQMDKLMPILIDLNNAFNKSIYNYNVISLDPVAALYGAEFIISKKEARYMRPLRSEVIFSIMDALYEKDKARFGNWIREIISFDPTNLVSDFGSQADLLADMNKVYSEIKARLKKSEDYQQAYMRSVLQDDDLFSLIADRQSLQAMKKKHDADVEKITEMEKKFEDGEQRRVKQHELIQERDHSIEQLREKLSHFNGISEKLEDVIRRYKLQVAMNETLTAEKQTALADLQSKLDDIASKFMTLTSEAEALKTQNEALEVDLSLKTNEVDRLTNSMAQKEEQSKKDVLKQLISGISDHMFYLSMYYLELNETGELMDISMFGDTLNQLKQAFAEVGVTQMGTLDETVVYDSAIHNVTDTSAANGDKVKVTGYGWKIGDEVFIKVPVEKGE